jgi:hypothetical protein
MSLCNIHTHKSAEHRGPGFMMAAEDARSGYVCDVAGSLSDAEMAEYEGEKAFEEVDPGDTIDTGFIPAATWSRARVLALAQAKHAAIRSFGLRRRCLFSSTMRLPRISASSPGNDRIDLLEHDDGAGPTPNQDRLRPHLARWPSGCCARLDQNQRSLTRLARFASVRGSRCLAAHSLRS